MQTRIGGVLVAAAVLAGAAVAAAGPASAGRAPQRIFHVTGPVQHPNLGRATLCDNTSDTMDDAVSSQNFDKKWNAYDSFGATDCKLAAKSTVHKVVVPGTYFNGSGPAKSEKVITYKDAAGLPGATVNKQTVVGTDDAGTFTIAITPLTLAKGTYWFTVQANMPFSKGQWGWDATATPTGKTDQWENPGNGFATCKTWCNVGTLDGTSTDLLIAIS